MRYLIFIVRKKTTKRKKKTTTKGQQRYEELCPVGQSTALSWIAQGHHVL